MQTPKRFSDKGQVLVFVAVVLVGVLLFAALTIDGGMIFSDRRVAQNAADAAALAGASEASKTVRELEKMDCSTYTSNPDVIKAAVNRAGANGFAIDEDLNNNNGVEILCSEDPGYVDVHVVISQQVKTSLIHLVFPWPIVNTVEAVARVNIPVYWGAGMALVALRDQCTKNAKGDYDGGIVFSGDSDIKVLQGGAYSNACAALLGSAGSVKVDDGVGYLTTWIDAGHKPLDPTTVYYKGSEPVKIDDSRLKIQCELLPDYGNPKDVSIKGNEGPKTIEPGNYKNITIGNGDDLTLKPGLYCIYGNVKLAGITRGTGVTLYMPATAGWFNTAGGAEIQLTAPPQGCHNPGGPSYEGCPPSVGGLLIYYLPTMGPGCTDCEVALRGNSVSKYEGTVYAPNSRVAVGGTGAGTNDESAMNQLGAQIIARTVMIHGTSTLTITYNKDLVYKDEATLQLNE